MKTTPRNLSEVAMPDALMVGARLNCGGRDREEGPALVATARVLVKGSSRAPGEFVCSSRQLVTRPCTGSAATR